MSSKIYEQYIENFDLNLLNCTFIGKGHNGYVYLLPNDKIIKICITEKSCRNEYFILNKINKNKYFPRTYGMCGNYMIRDYVKGTVLTDYIKHKGMDRNLAIKIIDLLQEFKKLNFSKEDIRCKDIMIQPDGTLMVIDPKKFYSKDRNFPKHLSKGLYNLRVLDYFMSVLKQERPNLYNSWHLNIADYIKERQKEDEK